MTAAGLLATALLGVPAAPAAGCPGVTVVVEPAQQQPQVACVPARREQSAAEVFEAAGHELTRVQRFPGAVCQVDAAPAEAACVAMPPADAYWGFFHAADTEWSYATLGVDSVVPVAGESVALAWQDTSTPVPPEESPAAPVPEGSSAPLPEAGDAGEGSAAGDGGALSPTVSAVVVLAVAAALGLVAWRRRGVGRS
jgi:hypothetical protein